MSRISRRFVEKLPKTDLHCHLDGSMRIETLIDLAQKNNVDLVSYEPEVLMEKMGYARVRKSLEDYLLGFDPLVAVLQSAEDIHRVFYEICEDARFENVWHIEIRYCPYLHTKGKLSNEDVVKTIAEASKKAQKDFGISVGQILCGLKNDEGASILEVAKLAAKFRNDGVVGFDLAGPEAGFPIRDHLEAISFAKKNHLFITLHAGESYGPMSIAQAIHEAGAHRVGHGTSLSHDQDLLNYVVDHRVGVEACVISNWHTGAVKSIAEHPIKAFLDRGVRVSVNTDNRLCSDTTITCELLALVEELDFSIEDIRKILVNGFKSAFLPYAERAKLLERFNLEWKELIKSN